MEKLGVRSKRIVLVFTALYGFVIAGRLIPGFPAYSLSYMMLSAIAIAWALSVKERIADRVSRGMLIAVSILLVSIHYMQMCKYSFFEHLELVDRYLWYAYYVPLIIIALLSMYVALRIGKDEDERIDRRFVLLIIPCILLIILTMTNDLHQWMFLFAPGFVNWKWDYDRGVVFYLDGVWIYGLMILALTVAIRRSVRTKSRDRAWIPLLVLILGLVLLIVFFMERSTEGMMFGRRILSFPIIFNLMIILFWESCIRIGLLPSNTNYGAIFHLSSIRAQITDGDGRVVYASESALPLTEEMAGVIPPLAVEIDEDTRLYCSKIRGGKVYWEEDISAITGINRELEQIYEGLQGENELAIEENRLLQDRVSLEFANNLYDEIADTLKPHLGKIQEILDIAAGMPEAGFKTALAEVTVYGAYIKRKANLILTGISEGEDRTLKLEDLRLAIAESLEYCKGLWIKSLVTLDENDEYPADVIIGAYDFFEENIERRMLDATDVMVVIDAGRGRMSMSISPGEDDEGLIYELGTPAERREP